MASLVEAHFVSLVVIADARRKEKL